MQYRAKVFMSKGSSQLCPILFRRMPLVYHHPIPACFAVVILTRVSRLDIGKRLSEHPRGLVFWRADISSDTSEPDAIQCMDSTTYLAPSAHPLLDPTRTSRTSRALIPLLTTDTKSISRLSPVMDAGSGVERPAKRGGGVGKRRWNVAG